LSTKYCHQSCFLHTTSSFMIRILILSSFQVDAELKDFEAEDERGEFAPQVVELDDDGRERDLIRL
jgi:hypothetical protein